ncbi:MAG: hypothetical protein FD126_1819 [Elusimicrobia bacterium]|nr:MAG: hypothetical protein FD126_1819 [Elusimicrobiota bacterium]
MKACDSASAFQSAASRAQTRAAVPPAGAALMRAAFSARCVRSVSKEAAKDLTPSASRRSVTAFKSTPCRRSSSSVRRASSVPSSTVLRTFPWSLKAFQVAGGMVLTVSGPMSSST